jgi:acyl-CoA synthetase (AMP-forming)/AMP-acid ligase II
VTDNLALPADARQGAFAIAGLIAYRASTPGAVAFIEGSSGRTLRWGDIDRAARAWPLRSTYVGLFIADPLQMIECLLAGLAAGATLALLDPASPPAVLAAEVHARGLSSVVTDRPDATIGALAGGELWLTGRGAPRLVHPAPPGREPSRWRLDDAALVLTSSGTTGSPKLVPVSEPQLVRTATAIADHHHLEPGDRGYCPLPLFHINAVVVGVLSTLVSGGALVVDRCFSARSFWETVRRYQATWLNLVPAIIAVLSTGEPPDPSVGARVRFARSASAHLPGPTRKRFERRCGIGVLETYGMTEAASQIAANPLDRSARRPGSVGLPVDVELRVVDGSGRHCAACQTGSVEIRGERVSSVYWAPAGSASPYRDALMPDGWLRTGDVGFLDATGYLYLQGRADDVINRGGEKICPREIEDVLLGDEGVHAAAVVARPDPVVGEVPVAFVSAHPLPRDPDSLVRRLEDRCDHKLSRFKRPAEIIVVPALPLGTTGKIQRAALRRVALTAVHSP